MHTVNHPSIIPLLSPSFVASVCLRLDFTCSPRETQQSDRMKTNILRLFYIATIFDDFMSATAIGEINIKLCFGSMTNEYNYTHLGATSLSLSLS